MSKRNGIVVWEDGTVFYYKDGKFHREGGPAIIYSNGGKFWWIDGKRHREDGPAIVELDGSNEYWLNDVRYFTKTTFKWALKGLTNIV